MAKCPLLLFVWLQVGQFPPAEIPPSPSFYNPCQKEENLDKETNSTNAGNKKSLCDTR